MSANGGLGRECFRFYAKLAEEIPEKRQQHIALYVLGSREK